MARSKAASRATVKATIEASGTPPDALAPTQIIARVLQAEGNSLYTCFLPKDAVVAAAASGESGADTLYGLINSAVNSAEADQGDKGAEGTVNCKVMLELNQRFNNTVYVLRGNFVVADLTVASNSRIAGRKVVGEIVNVISEEKAWRKKPYWPASFASRPTGWGIDQGSTAGQMPPSDSESDDEE